MKGPVTIAFGLFLLALGLVIFLHFRDVRKHSSLGWGPEPRAVKVISVDEISASAFYGSDGGADIARRLGNSFRYYYTAKGFDVLTGASLRWKLECDGEIKPPTRVTFTPFGETSGVRLEIHSVVGGPYKDEQEAMTRQGGAITADEIIATGPSTGTGRLDGDTVYIVLRTPVVGGLDFSGAEPGFGTNGQRNVQFTLTKEAGDRFYDYTSKNVGKSMAVLMGGRIREVAIIKSAIRDRGEIEGTFTEVEVAMLSRLLSIDALQKRRSESYGSLALADSAPKSHCNVSPDDRHNYLRWFN